MNDQRLIKISKYLSKHLRHQPERIGLELAAGGWVAVADVLAACARHSFPISAIELREVVARNNKQRFAFDADETHIRASQGHSVSVDLALQPITPPARLYHGTNQPAVAIIVREGIRKMNRHHVHLSIDVATAQSVGARRGKAVILTVDAAAMAAAGHQFFCSANGVWLVDHVPPQYVAQQTNHPDSLG
jgi:putative RNA 2'-phosphotransferase